MNAERHDQGRTPDAQGHHHKLVDRLVVHGTPIDFRTLCERTVPPETRYLVLDLDRTLHLGRNMGELLGWELCALWGYGPEHLARLERESERPAGRLLIDFSSPRKLLRYVLVGGRIWAYPGLFYLLFGKMPTLSTRARRASYHLFGPEPVRQVQRVPQTTLLHLLSRLPLETLRALSASVWDRHREDQVVEREDIAWLRARCPGITIIITSASPRPMLEVAGEKLGVDHVDYSTLEEHEGQLSSPMSLRRLFWPKSGPRRIAPPSTLRINASHTKVEGLLARFPDFCAPGVVTVGMSDTGYGEDHCWADSFTHVVDVNSDTPFAPVVAASSPIREIHSAAVLSRKERDARRGGQPDYLDPRRRPAPSFTDQEFTHEQLVAALAPVLEELQTLACHREACAASVGPGKRTLERRAREIHDRIEEAVRAYNETPAEGRALILAQVEGLASELDRLTRRMVRLERSLAQAAFAVTRTRELARRMLEGQLGAAQRAPADDSSRHAVA